MEGLKDLIDAGILDPDFAQMDTIPRTMSDEEPYNPRPVTTSDPNHQNMVRTINEYHNSENRTVHRNPDRNADRTDRTEHGYRNAGRRHLPRTEENTYQLTARPGPAPRTYHDVHDTSDEDDVNDADKYSYYREVKYHWLFGGRSNPGWWHFPQKDNDRLEHKYQKGKSETKLNINGQILIVDFNNMTQRNGDAVRNILRVETLKDIYLKGIAGESVSKETLLNPPTFGRSDVAAADGDSRHDSDFRAAEDAAEADDAAEGGAEDAADDAAEEELD